MNKTLRSAIRFPFAVFSEVYFRIFARPSMQRFNNGLLNLALRARGYNNFQNFSLTGERNFIRLLAKQNPKLCIDIGANKGRYAKELLDLTGSTVISFEPLPKAFQSLLELKKRFPERFQCINKGVGDRNAHLELFYGAEDSAHASFSPDVNQVDYVGRSNVNSMRVEVTTLDSFFENQLSPKGTEIDLLKIDTEGFEYEVLIGARKTLSDLQPKFVQVEYNWHQLFRSQSLFKLASLLPGYRAYQLLPYGEGLALRNPKEPESNIYHFANFVFVRDDIAFSDLAPGRH